MFTTPITGFHCDDVGDWVAELGCGHTQHVRHRPPWQLRPWVLTAEGRAEKLGLHLPCPLCRMPELPENAQAYQRTPTFTEVTTPAGLLRDHHTKPGVWGRIVVESGELEYTLQEPQRTVVLTPTRPGIVPPQEPHFVHPNGSVAFHVVFLRVPDTTAP